MTRTALVIGAGNNLGAAIARRFGRDGLGSQHSSQAVPRNHFSFVQGRPSSARRRNSLRPPLKADTQNGTAKFSTPCSSENSPPSTTRYPYLIRFRIRPTTADTLSAKRRISGVDAAAWAMSMKSLMWRPLGRAVSSLASSSPRASLAASALKSSSSMS